MQMRVCAKAKGKSVPSYKALDKMISGLINMLCPECGHRMKWLRKDSPKHVLTLQHDRSGKMRLLCFSCNTRHHYLPGDRFYTAPTGKRFCQDCKKFLPLASFFADRGLVGGVKTYCKVCSNRRTYTWRRRVQYKGKKDWNKY